MKKVFKFVFSGVCIACCCFCVCSCRNSKDNLPDFVKNDMSLVWSDEFNGESDEPDPAVWDFKEGAHGWGNGELQNYTNRRENSYVSDGTLKITAQKDSHGKWTSARLFSQYKKTMLYGYLEFRAKVPVEKGCWPALWLLPEKTVYGAWPRSGEIDIMEASQNVWGSTVYGTAHCLAGHGGNPVISTGRDIKNRENWHTYALNWTPEGLTWYFDGTILSEYRNPHESEDGWTVWPFDQPFYIIMNVAMGGNLGGDINGKIESCTMEIDYVRLYQ